VILRRAPAYPVVEAAVYFGGRSWKRTEAKNLRRVA
jgi:hypothetical protein